MFREQFVNGGPRADVAPADFGGNNEDGRHGLAGRRLKNRIIHGDVLELGVDGAKFSLVAALSDAFPERFPRREGFWQMSVQIFEKTGCAPEKHSSGATLVA